jgi:hypothetical protein
MPRPEALIYEPSGDQRRLVAWSSSWTPRLAGEPQHSAGARGQPSSRRQPEPLSLPVFFELHVWAWRTNPSRAFVDWNNQVTCERQ